MKTLTISGLVAMVFGFGAPEVRAGAMTDVCHARAKYNSGYTGPRTGLDWQVGQVNFRLSGTLALGVSRSSGAGQARSPGFAGASAIERREDRARADYNALYTACMQSG